MRVWPGGRGTMLCTRVSPDVWSGLPKACSASPCPPDVLIFLLTGHYRQLWQSIESPILHQGECQTKQPIQSGSDYLPSAERVGMDWPLSPLLCPGTEIRVESQHRYDRCPGAISQHRPPPLTHGRMGAPLPRRLRLSGVVAGHLDHLLRGPV